MEERAWARLRLKTPAAREKLAADILRFFSKPACLRRQARVGGHRAKAGVFLVANSELRTWKRRYLGLAPREVDVLSFPSSNFPTKLGPERLGEVYLNRTIVRREPERGVRLLIHGIAHLLGFSHAGKRDTIRMQKQEKEIYNRLRRS